MRETGRKKPTSLGWIIIVVIFVAFVLGMYLWIVPDIRTDPTGTLIRVVVLLAVFAVAMTAVRKLGGKRLFRE